MVEDGDRFRRSRRAVLRASGAALGLAGVGTARAGDGGGLLDRCPDATTEPAMHHCEGSETAGCTDSHPETVAIRQRVQETFDRRLPTVGALLDDGYVPYFDFLDTDGDGNWSHWLNPEYIGDSGVADPDRPASVLVDHRWWRPIGVMFIATENGERVEDPPDVYVDESDGDGDGDETQRCSPWHHHVGLPGRYSWWKYRLAYEETDGVPAFPCRTPCVMHVWTYPNPDGVYAHGAPPQADRGGPPAEEAGFETDADPQEDDLGPEVLPDAVREMIA